MIISNWLEIIIIQKVTTFVESTVLEGEKTLFLIGAIILISNTLTYGASVFCTYLVAYLTQKGYSSFFEEFLYIIYPEFTKYSIGEIQYCIQRRATSLGVFFQMLTIRFMMGLLFFIVAVIKICFSLPLMSTIKVIFGICIFLTFVGVLQIFRADVRIKGNTGFEENGKKMYDILFNYERIVAYNNLNLELQKYYKAQYNQNYYLKIFWILYEFGNLTLDILLVLLSTFILLEYNEKSLLGNINVKNEIGELTILLKNLENYVKVLSKDIAFLVTHYTNFTQSLTDDVETEHIQNKISIKQIEKGITASNLSFTRGNKVIFNNVNVAILNGKKIAITGLSGCGKSTFMNILLGFNDYQGSLEIDGWEFSSLNIKDIRDLIAYVPQDSQLFDMSIMENIKMGNNTIDNETVIDLCKKYNYHKLFKKLGYNFKVGSRGKCISGGERQKIAFMRAMVKDTPLIFLDEPTANLDKTSEKELIINLITYSPDKTVLMIVHNLKILKYFDLIFFFANHTLKSVGSFDDLYSNDKTFNEYYISSTTKSKI